MYTIVGMAKDELSQTGPEGYEKQWKALKKIAMSRYQGTDTEHLRMTIGYLKKLAEDKDHRKDADKVERYICEFREVLMAMVEE